MRGNMNNGYINRNRIYRMNRNAMMNEEVIINKDLFCLPAEVALANDIDFDIERSIRPFAIGVMTGREDDKKYYYAYENSINCEDEWTEKFDTFKHAVIFAREIYNYRIAQRNIILKYEEDTRILRK